VARRVASAQVFEATEYYTVFERCPGQFAVGAGLAMYHDHSPLTHSFTQPLTTHELTNHHSLPSVFAN